jgi:hypothetical protein
LAEQGVQGIIEDFQPSHFGIAKVDDHARAIGGFDSRLPQGIAQPDRTRFADGMASGIWRV